MDSVVDPGASGHCSGGTWRQGEMLAPNLRPRESRTTASRAGFFGLGSVNCYHCSRELERKGVTL